VVAGFRSGRKDGEYRARIALAGLQPKDLKVVATPDSLIIEAERSHTHEDKDGTVRLCEFSDKKLFRRLDLPSRIDVDRTNGIFGERFAPGDRAEGESYK